MTNDASPLPPKPAGGKVWFFRAVTTGVIVMFGVLAAEFGLRWQQARVSRSDALEAGMIDYDADLGWKLTPGWNGRHQHHDFEARYSINASGFRDDAPFPEGPEKGKVTIVVGDSFTFGLGVNDSETFVHLLNSAQTREEKFANAAVPGYSTDQEALLIEKELLRLHPDRILLVVYVGNDLLDNTLPIPMQVGSPKPYFEATDQGLARRNSPVPLGRTTRRSAPGLLPAVLGPNTKEWALKIRLEQRSEIFRIFSQSVLPEKTYVREFESRFAPAVHLFGRIMDRIAENCAKEKVKLAVALMAGRSFCDSPGSVSAQYQDYFLHQVTKYCREKPLVVIDVASSMQARYSREGKAWFFPHDGHLTASGHRIVAEIITEQLRRGQTVDKP